MEHTIGIMLGVYKVFPPPPPSLHYWGEVSSCLGRKSSWERERRMGRKGGRESGRRKWVEGKRIKGREKGQMVKGNEGQRVKFYWKKILSGNI